LPHVFRGVNRLQITKDLVCEKLLNDSVAVLLIQGSREHRVAQNVFSTAAYALTIYRVPTIGVSIQQSEFSNKVRIFWMFNSKWISESLQNIPPTNCPVQLRGICFRPPVG
jgi:hypothetical protein